MILKPSEFYTLQDQTKLFSFRRVGELYIGSQYSSLLYKVLINSSQLQNEYFQNLIEKFPEYVSIEETTHPYFKYWLYVYFEPSKDSEWQEIIFNNASDIFFPNRPNLFSSVSHAIDKIKDFKILKKTTNSLLLCQFGKYQKFLIYTTASLNESIEIYKINTSYRDNQFFIPINAMPLLESEEA